MNKIIKNSIYLFLIIIYFGCSERMTNQEIILNKLVYHFIELNNEEVTKLLKSNDNSDFNFNVWIYVSKDRKYRYHKDFDVYHISYDISCYLPKYDMNVLDSTEQIIPKEFPTKIDKIDNVYILYFDNNQVEMKKSEIPKEFFIESSCMKIDGPSFTVLICKNNNNFCVVRNDYALPCEYIEQFQNFSCDNIIDQSVSIDSIQFAIQSGDIPPPLFEEDIIFNE